MTTIAFKDGVMAGDSRTYSGNRDYAGSKQKIRRLEDGTLIGASATIVGGGERVIEWYINGAPNDPGDAFPADAFSLLVAKPNGEIFLADNKPLLSGPLSGPFFAIGTGSDIAIGAMAAKMNAIEAVRLSCIYDVWSELPIYAASHSGEMPVLWVDIPPDKLIWLK